MYSLLLLLTATVGAFQHMPSVTTVKNTINRSPLFLYGRPTTALQATISIPNPLSKLPWNQEKQRKIEARNLKKEAAVLYRQLGVAEDATYEEITAATNAAIAKLDPKDIKAKVKVEIVKDKILNLRLQQRMGGMMGETSAERIENSLRKDYEAEQRKKGQKVKQPKWMMGLYRPPADSYEVQQQAIKYGAMTLFALIFPGTCQGIKFLNFLLFAATLQNRGMPKFPKEYGPPPPEYKKHYLTAVLLSFGIFGFAYFGGAVMVQLMIEITKAKQPMESVFNSYINVPIGILTFLASIYLQPFKGKKDLPKDED